MPLTYPNQPGSVGSPTLTRSPAVPNTLGGQLGYVNPNQPAPITPAPRARKRARRRRR